MDDSESENLQERETDRPDSDGQGGKRIRIHVGGLGESVTEEDLHRLFGGGLGGGTVEGVDIIRTKGRSFAYVDFLPCSDKSLSKLFTTYNGCAWKGGKLSLHKAKEDYLVRMKREWAQDSQQPPTAPHNHHPLVPWPPPQSQEPSNTTKQLRIFFPSLRTVKSLPFTGTGKHKYSFQRVQVPALPINFCDCEEHSHSSHLAAAAHQSPISHGINDQELSIMTKVMDQLFQSRVDASHPHESNQQHHELDVASAADEEDNLIINVVSSNREKEKNISEFQELRAGGTQASKDEGPSQDAFRAQKILDRPPKKKRISQPVDYNNQNEPGSEKNLPTRSKDSSVKFLGVEPDHQAELGVQQVSWSQKSSWRQLVGHKGSSTFSVSHLLTGNASSTDQLQPKSSSSELPHSDGENQDFQSNLNPEGRLCQMAEVDGYVEAQSTKSGVVSNKSGRGASWRHQSSWTQLVNSNTDSSFSIEQIVPGVSLEQQSFPKLKGGDAVRSADSKLKQVVKQESDKFTRGGSSALGLGTEGEVVLHSPEETVVNNGGARTPDEEKVIPPTPTEASSGIVEISKTCSFIRSASSVKEWARIKAALSGSQKKKNVAN